MFLSIVYRFKILYINICNVMHRNLYLMMEEISLEVTYSTSILRVPVECYFIFKQMQYNILNKQCFFQSPSP